MQGKVNDGPHVIIMCKAPVPGFVKTRLCSGYSAKEAAEIHQAMATTVIERANRIFSHVSIASDDIEHPFFKTFTLNMISQSEGDLGARMTHLLLQAFADREGPVLFLGTDSPHMSESRLHQVIERLPECDVVIGPVEDGGYDLIAMNQPYIEVFQDIQWSSEHVLKETMKRAKTSGIKIEQLDLSYDLDTPESLKRVAPIWHPPVLLPEKDSEN